MLRWTGMRMRMRMRLRLRFRTRTRIKTRKAIDVTYPPSPLCTPVNSSQLHISTKHVSVVTVVSSAKTSRAKGSRGSLRSKAGIAQMVKGRWKSSSRSVYRGKNALWLDLVGERREGRGGRGGWGKDEVEGRWNRKDMRNGGNRAT
jgi:hypothetical protein